MGFSSVQCLHPPFLLPVPAFYFVPQFGRGDGKAQRAVDCAQMLFKLIREGSVAGRGGSRKKQPNFKEGDFCLSDARRQFVRPVQQGSYSRSPSRDNPWPTSAHRFVIGLHTFYNDPLFSNWVDKIQLENELKSFLPNGFSIRRIILYHYD